MTIQRPSSTRIFQLLWAAAWIVLALLVLDNLRTQLGPYLSSDSRDLFSSIIADHIDVPLILHSLQAKPTFASTFAWWHSSWIPEVPFWRPLSIQAFWIEAHVFSTSRYDLWLWVSCIGHLVMLGALVSMTLTVAVGKAERSADRARRLAIMWLTIWIFAAAKIGGFSPTILGDLFNRASANVVLYAWKNQPDIFTDLFVFLTLTLVATRRWWPGLVCAFIAVAFKESGWMAWLLAGVLLTLCSDWRRVPAPVYVAAGVSIVVLLVLRWISGPDVFRGFHQGSNHSWGARYSIAVGGNYLYSLVEQPYCFILGHVLVLFAWLRSKRRSAAGYVTLCVGIACAMALQMHMTKDPLDATIVSYLDPQLSGSRTFLVLGIYVQICGVWLALRNPMYRRLWLFAMMASAISAMPFAAAAQVQPHALHQTYAFESMAWATILVALIDRWRVIAIGHWHSIRRPDRPVAPSTSPAA